MSIYTQSFIFHYSESIKKHVVIQLKYFRSQVTELSNWIFDHPKTTLDLSLYNKIKASKMDSRKVFLRFWLVEFEQVIPIHQYDRNVGHNNGNGSNEHPINNKQSATDYIDGAKRNNFLHHKWKQHE